MNQKKMLIYGSITVVAAVVIISLLANVVNSTANDNRIIIISGRDWYYEKNNGTYMNFNVTNALEVNFYSQVNIAGPGVGISAYKIGLSDSELSTYLGKPLYCANGTSHIFKAEDVYGASPIKGYYGIGFIFKYAGSWYIFQSFVGDHDLQENLFSRIYSILKLNE